MNSDSHQGCRDVWSVEVEDLESVVSTSNAEIERAPNNDNDTELETVPRERSVEPDTATLNTIPDSIRQQEVMSSSTTANVVTTRAGQRAENQTDPIVSAPPSYSGPPQHPLFIPYTTQELPHYSEIDDHNQRRERQLGYVHQHSHGGHFIPIQIPGYIPSDEPQFSPHTLPALTNHTHRFTTNAMQARTIPNASRVSNDYLGMTFALLICCIAHLNLPAVLFSLSALACSIKARDLNTHRMYEESRKYITMVLICDSMAIIEFILLVIVGFLILILKYVFNLPIL